jgi:hypothetical protein
MGALYHLFLKDMVKGNRKDSHYYNVAMDKWPTAAVPSLLWCPSSDGCTSPVATMGHVTHTIATSAHNSDEPSDISGSLLLPPTMATGYLTLEYCCYYGGTCHGRGCY